LGVSEWIADKKAQRAIKNIGFSYHGGRADFIRICDIYGWDFCMIQYNFLDENNQAGKAGLEYAAGKNIPVIVMEPLRGGRLVTGLPKEAYKLYENAYVKRTPAEWALRWVWNHPQALTVLSGMNGMGMIEENIRAASEAQADSFTEADFELFEKVRQILNEKIKVPCTACGYCLPCPKGVDIPACFSCLNDTAIEKKSRAFINYLMQTTMKKQTSNASLCTGCGKCVPHCPQGIAIPQELRKVKKRFERVLYRPARWFIKKFMRIK
jgi:predicted aldo/keto reductase-like oxidoreductase